MMSYFQLTIKKFFLKDGSIDLYAFLFGLLFLFTFAFMQLPDWLTILASTLLASSVFRYITTDELFHEEIVNLSTPGQVIDYTISKNLFTILFELILLFIVFLLLSFLKVFGFLSASDRGQGIPACPAALCSWNRKYYLTLLQQAGEKLPERYTEEWQGRYSHGY